MVTPQMTYLVFVFGNGFQQDLLYNFPRLSSLSFLRLGPMFASFLSLWASLKLAVSSLTVTPVSLSGAAAPLDLGMSSWPRSHQSGSFSTESNSSHPQALPLGSEAELRAKCNRKKQADRKNWGNQPISTSPAALWGGLTFPFCWRLCTETCTAALTSFPVLASAKLCFSNTPSPSTDSWTISLGSSRVAHSFYPLWCPCSSWALLLLISCHNCWISYKFGRAVLVLWAPLSRAASHGILPSSDLFS